MIDPEEIDSGMIDLGIIESSGIGSVTIDPSDIDTFWIAIVSDDTDPFSIDLRSLSGGKATFDRSIDTTTPTECPGELRLIHGVAVPDRLPRSVSGASLGRPTIGD